MIILFFLSLCCLIHFEITPTFIVILYYTHIHNNESQNTLYVLFGQLWMVFSYVVVFLVDKYKERLVKEKMDELIGETLKKIKII